METNRLKQFRVVAEVGNLRKAARLLGISHSGLSKSLKALEEELGFTLFLPRGRGFVISDRARDFYERCGPVLEGIDRLLHPEVSSSSGGGPPPFRLGSFEVFTSSFMGELVREYLPGTPIEVHELTPGRLEEALLLQQVDVGITYEPIPRSGIQYVSVTRIGMAAYALQGRFQKGIDLGLVPFVAPVNPLEGAPSGVRGRDGWPDERYRREIRYRVDLMTTGLELVRQGACAIFIPRFVAYLHNQSALPHFKLERIETPRGMPEVRREVFLVTRESTEETPAIRKLAQALRKVCSLSP